MKQNRERLKKHENNSNESGFSENGIPDTRFKFLKSSRPQFSKSRRKKRLSE